MCCIYLLGYFGVISCLFDIVIVVLVSDIVDSVNWYLIMVMIVVIIVIV